ncbi:hypothetical protein M413DRAFT_13849 [Hebeloma cylindrosporum]|uniref:NAD(P)-binding protein n=1 Tax=Hebeloma cylindrosporum TaxID=76867 RepID=A0A0C3BZ31_HEBCY|nr:hypothetical protein M413DRAFT_13849 [Hebeloma cylindrosporum h7]
MSISSAIDLSGRVGLVTGGGTGIGLMIAQGLASCGAKVYIAGRRVDVLEKSAAGYQGKGSIVALCMDVVDEESIKKGVKFISEADGKLDILVNNAGITTPLGESDFATKKFEYSAEGKIPMELHFKLNVFAPFFVTSAFLELLEKGARSRIDGTSSVINISGCAAVMKSGFANLSFAYATTKAALDQITTSLAADLARRKVPVRINAIEPGAFPTDIVPAEIFEEYRTKPLPGLIAPVPLLRWGKPEEIALTAVYLASTGYTNGIVLRVDGGLALVNP